MVPSASLAGSPPGRSDEPGGTGIGFPR